jgi:hypothetical protein
MLLHSTPTRSQNTQPTQLLLPTCSSRGLSSLSSACLLAGAASANGLLLMLCASFTSRSSTSASSAAAAAARHGQRVSTLQIL